VSQPSTPGLSELPKTVEEVHSIRKHAGSLRLEWLNGTDATVKNVVRGMERHSWIHLACHAIQHANDPTKSALCLEDGQLELAEIITKSFPHAEFIFLSACQTASDDESLSEEAVHLAAGMQLAGYRSVIATMWSIRDQDAPLITNEVYSCLLEDSRPDSTQAARALHRAVKRLREEVGEKDFLSWMPFVHIGL